ncbi:MAG: Hydantoin utilization protein, partial [Hyphomicrobiales bacterium]|nr:Hydantoin utilization protein [Hyphomicrobiales bacterium]
TVVIPTAAGVGSAYGFLKAPIAYEAVHSRIMHLARFDADSANAIFAELRVEAEGVVRIAAGDRPLRERRFADMRYKGQGHELSVEIPAALYAADDAAKLAELFEAQYQKNYGRRIPNLSVEALTWTLVLTAQEEREAPRKLMENARSQAEAIRTTRVFDAEVGDFVDAQVIRRETTRPGSVFSGPALIVEDQTTVWAPSSFHGQISPGGHVILRRKD